MPRSWRGAHPVLSRSVHLTAAGAPSAQGEAAAMSTLLGQLADDIAARLSGASSGAQQ